MIIEREFKTEPVHQGYIEPHACLASVSEDGQADVWVSTQGHWIVRAHCARLLGMGHLARSASPPPRSAAASAARPSSTSSRWRSRLSAKARKPVKMVMTREEVFRASGPTSGAKMRIKIGATKDGRIVAAEGELKYQAGAFQGSPVQPGCMCAFAPYDLENVKVVGYDVVVNRPKVAAYRAPGGPISELRGRERGRRARPQAQARPDRVPPEERGQGRHQGRLRAEVRPRRPGRDAGGGPRPPPLEARR